MAFLGRVKKVDLQCLADELGETVTKDMKVAGLRKLILESKEYDEVFVKELLDRIVSEREEEILRQEKAEAEEILRQEKADEILRQEKREEEIRRHEEEMKRQEAEMKLQENEFLLEKLRIEAAMMNNDSKRETGSQNDGMQEHAQVGLQKLMRKFDPKEGDISFFLILFERQARRVQIKEEDWVTNLVGLLPLEMANLIAREPEEKANDYEHVKNILLKRFKLSPEAFKIKFKRHCKLPENTWRDFGFELANYFNEWIMGLKINDFESLKQLVIVEQMKEQVSSDIQQHFIDEWGKIVTVDILSEKLDEYENARQYNQGSKESSCQSYSNGYQEKKSFNNRNQGYNEEHRQGFNNRRGGFDRRNSFQKPITCYNCGRTGHVARFCRDKNEERGRDVAKVAEVKIVEEEEIESKAVTSVFSRDFEKENVKGDAVEPRFSDLKIVKISYGGAEYDAIVDSGAEISVFKSSVVGREVKGKDYIMLKPAFGKSLKAELKEVEIALVTNSFCTPVIKTVVATLDGLNADILLDTKTYETLLEQERIYSSTTTAAMKLEPEDCEEKFDEMMLEKLFDEGLENEPEDEEGEGQQDPNKRVLKDNDMDHEYLDDAYEGNINTLRINEEKARNQDSVENEQNSELEEYRIEVPDINAKFKESADDCLNRDDKSKMCDLEEVVSLVPSSDENQNGRHDEDNMEYGEYKMCIAQMEERKIREPYNQEDKDEVSKVGFVAKKKAKYKDRNAFVNEEPNRKIKPLNIKFQAIQGLQDHHQKKRKMSKKKKKLKKMQTLMT